MEAATMAHSVTRIFHMEPHLGLYAAGSRLLQPMINTSFHMALQAQTKALELEFKPMSNGLTTLEAD
jgi:hypothetical protein